MWMPQNRPVQVSFVMFVLVMIVWPSVVQTMHGNSSDVYDDEDDDDDPKILFYKPRPPELGFKIEVVIVIDSWNNPLGLNKALTRALKSIPIGSVLQDNSPGRNVLWRVKNFVLRNTSVEKEVGQSDFDEQQQTSVTGESGGERQSKPSQEQEVDSKSQRNLFHPNLIPQLCNFLGRTKAVALVNLIEDAGSERLLSLIANSASIPLIGSFQSTEPFQTQQKKSEDDLHVSLTTSVRQYARALGHLLIYCHWHSFTVIFDDVPSTLSSQLIWKSELSSTKISMNSLSNNSALSTIVEDEYDSNEEFDYEVHGGNDADPASAPLLKPAFASLSSKRLNNTAFRVLNELTKYTQGIIVLLCSETSLAQVFRAAQQLRMLNGAYIFIIVDQYSKFEVIPDWVPSGVLALRSPQKAQVGKQSLTRVGKLLASAMFLSLRNLSQERVAKTQDPTNRVFNTFMTSSSSGDGSPQEEFDAQQTRIFITPSQRKKNLTSNDNKNLFYEPIHNLPNVSCWKSSYTRKLFSETLTRQIRQQIELSNPTAADDSSADHFDILNLVGPVSARFWKTVGNVSVEQSQVHLETIRWPGGNILSTGEEQLKSYRIVTIMSPPFVMVVESLDNKTCEKGLPCLTVQTNNQDELALIFADFESGENSRSDYRVACCDGFAMDLLYSISRELSFKINLYLVPDGFFGSLSSSGDWNGLMSAILSGSAHMCFAPFSVTSIRSTAIDFSTPFFFSGVGFLGIAKTQDVPLLAFLAPFSFELWAAIFITLNITAIAVALFEWLSPFGLNPWGRQRTKNFTMASALWVTWGRLFSHLVQYKAPKSWPNKFLINVWGGFSVIFVASYTANIAALFAGMFFERGIDLHDRSLLSQRVAAVKHSATHFYIKRENQLLWEHIQKFPVFNFQQGIDMLKNGSLDLLTGDGPLLDYYRGADPYCSLIDVSDHAKIGDDTYAVAMAKGFPLKESVSALIAKYIGNGYMDHLQGKWYDQLGCFRRRRSEIAGARALGVDSVAGMIIMLALGVLVGLLILFMELIVYKYALPYFRKQPKGTLWRSPNIMFFSQKLYRFINCVELVSPHHAAKELMNTLKHGQITSLFQKSVKRKEHEQRRRRKSKAQFFEMIQEVRRVQKQERQKRVQGKHGHESEVEVFSVQARLQSNKNMPKLIRVLGVEADVSNKVFETSTAGGEPFQGPVLVVEVPTTVEEIRNNEIMETELGREIHETKRRKILKKSGPSTFDSVPVLHKFVDFNLQEDVEDDDDIENVKTEFGNEEDGSRNEETETFSSSLSRTNLSSLSKSQVIKLWKSSELELRGQLTEVLKEKEALTLKLQSLDSAKPP